MRIIDEANANGCRLLPACKEVGISKRTYERWKSDDSGDQRRGPLTTPANKLTEEEVLRVLSVVNSEIYRDKPPTQIVPSLADKGVYIASESSFYRILKSSLMAAHRSRSKPRQHARPKELVAMKPNELWSWDITYLPTVVSGMFFYLYLVMDVYSRKIVGFEVQGEQTAELASRMIKRLCSEEGISRDQLHLHSDNGKPMKGATMLATLQRLGVMPSFSRPHVSDDNPFSEALFRTLKYCPIYPSKPFATLDEARQWVERFIKWYNNEHLHSGIKFVTPASRHNGKDEEILAMRREVYEKAKMSNPHRWSATTRNWEKDGRVYLNRLKGNDRSDTKKAA